MKTFHSTITTTSQSQYTLRWSVGRRSRIRRASVAGPAKSSSYAERGPPVGCVRLVEVRMPKARALCICRPTVINFLARTSCQQRPG